MLLVWFGGGGGGCRKPSVQENECYQNSSASYGEHLTILMGNQ